MERGRVAETISGGGAWSYANTLRLDVFLASSSVLLLAIVLLASYQYGKAAWGYYGGRKVPPGSFGLPLVGETLQFAFNNTGPIGSPPPFLSCRLRKYGTVFKTHMLGYPTVVSMDPDLNKLLLSNEEKLVQVNFPKSIKKIVGPILTMHGERHRQFRELMTSILSPTAIQSLHLIPFQEHTCSILRSWLHTPIFDAQQEFRKYIFTYIVKTLFSLTPEDPNTELLMRDFLLLRIGYSAIPIDVPGTTFNKVLKARKRILTMLTRLVRGRKNITKAEHKDFMDVLLKEGDECGNNFTESDIVESIFSMILGGFETTSVLLTNIMKFLSENVHVVDELRKEHMFIRRDKKENEWLAWDDFKQMQFTKFVIKETLRIASIAHFVTREAIQDIVFKDMIIPKGWTILINFSMVHLSPRYYKNPLKFDPWRWKDTKTMNQSTLMPFSGGIRMCTGSFLAEFEASIFIHYLMTRYKWERITKPSGELDVVSSLSFPTMKKGLNLKVEPL